MSDDRQFQVRERAGLDEARLNQEFIQFIRNWGAKAILAFALIVLAYSGYHRWQQSVAAEVSTAFDDLSEEHKGERPNPLRLLDIADKYGSVKSVGLLARLHAADAYMQAVRTRAAVGAAINADGTLKDATGALTDELRDQYLSAAKTQYQKVLDATRSDPRKSVLAVSAAFGLAAVAESGGNFTDATEAYKVAIAVCEASSDGFHAEVANTRLANIDSIKAAPLVLSAAELPKPPAPPAPIPVAPTPDTPSAVTPGVEAPAGPAPAVDPNAPAAPAPTPTPTPAPTPDPASPTPPATPK